MDPNATWTELLDAALSGDWREAAECGGALVAWLDRDGFPPAVTAREGLSELDTVMVRAACRLAIHHVKKAR